LPVTIFPLSKKAYITGTTLSTKIVDAVNPPIVVTEKEYQKFLSESELIIKGKTPKIVVWKSLEQV